MKIQPMKTMIRPEMKPGKITKRKPRSFMRCVPVTAMTAIAPPGGCSDFVRHIARKAKETARQERSHSLYSEDVVPRIFHQITPTRDEIVLPTTTFHGYALKRVRRGAHACKGVFITRNKYRQA